MLELNTAQMGPETNSKPKVTQRLYAPKEVQPFTLENTKLCQLLYKGLEIENTGYIRALLKRRG